MRINKYIAKNTSLSRRNADDAIRNGRVKLNDEVANLGDDVSPGDELTIDSKRIVVTNSESTTILLNKPVGYVCSKDGQGSKTVYDLLPEKYKDLNIAGRLDKDSSGLVVLTNNGELLNELTHPSFNKEKIYELEIDRELAADEIKKLKSGVDIGDNRPSKFKNIEKIGPQTYEVVLEEGRNRQIRRTIEGISSTVTNLHRLQISDLNLDNLKTEEFREII